MRASSAVASTAACGPPKVRAASDAGSPVHASLMRATRPAGVVIAPKPAAATVAASGQLFRTFASTFASALTTVLSVGAQAAPVVA